MFALPNYMIMQKKMTNNMSENRSTAKLNRQQ